MHAYAAVTDEAAGVVEHRFAADLKVLLRAVGVNATEHEIQEWLPLRNASPQRLALRIVPASYLNGGTVSRLGRQPDSEHLEDRAGKRLPSLQIYVSS